MLQQLASKKVNFRLSPEGVNALKGFLDKPAFTAFVEEVDDLGAWIVLAKSSSLMLLKWDYFATAVIDFEQPEVSTAKN